MEGKELVKLLKKNGWQIDRISGSHHIMVKGSRTISVPVHGKQELGKGLTHAILKQAEIRK
ncbi:MAG: type II toxin-antitoxin system HicA family toxin [Candidatus Marinimicrobia bacterium]|nr:type II toxin-antitoxin system HicA family toxin [Candidatus Neomarinimicrobiota bacterium]